MDSKKTSTSFKRKLIGMAVVSCFAGNAHSAPTGASVVSGSASIATSGSTMTVTNTPNAIINWASFSINTSETVRFIQQSASSAVLNRVTGSAPSGILGALQSNGKVFLVNPNGILFGAGARIDVNGLVASTLNMTDADFLAGRMRFNADRALPGGVSNAGTITTPSGGFVYMLAPNVENSGVITTPSGEAILAAGNSVELVDSTNPSQRVVVSAKSQDVNLSQLMTQSNGNIFSVLNSGKVSANTVVQDETGRIYFKSAGNIQTTSTSVVEAKGDLAANGGRIQAFADGDGSYAGSFNASGKNGGFIETSGSTLDVNGIDINAQALSPTGLGGMWLLDPYDFTIDAYGASAISSALSSGTNVTVDTAFSTFTGGSGTPGPGNITVDATINNSGSYGSHLYLFADHDIIFTAYGGIANTGTGPLATSLNTANDIFLNTGSSINIKGGLYGTAGANITTYGSLASPEVHLFAGGNITTNSTISATGNAFHNANILLIAGGNIALNAGVTASDNSSYGSFIEVMANGTASLNSSISTLGTGNSSIYVYAPTISASGGSISANTSGSGTAEIEFLGDSISIGNEGIYAWSSYGSAFVEIDSLGTANVTNSSVYANSASSAGHGISMFAEGQLLLNNSDLQFSYGGDILLVSQDLQITNGSQVHADYVGLNYDPDFIRSNTAEFFSFNSTSKVTVDNSTVWANSGLGFSGNNVTVQNGGILETDGLMHGIVMNDLKLMNSGGLFSQSGMLLETGGHIYLDNGGFISLASGANLGFNFPLLASGGWLVDGVEGIFTGSHGSIIRVGGAEPILNSNFFVTYGGLGTIGGVIGATTNDMLNSTETNTAIEDNLLADAPTGDDFFGSAENGSGTSEEQNGSSEEKEKPKEKEDKPQQCS